MTYSTITDILKDLPLKELVNLTNDENRPINDINLSSDADIVVVRVKKAIADADNEIDAYLRSRYTLPLQNVPSLITKISCDIAIYNLFCRRFRVDIPYRDVYLSRIAELKLIQNGQMSLDISSDIDKQGYYLTNKNSDSKIFNSETLNQFWSLR